MWTNTFKLPVDLLLSYVCQVAEAFFICLRVYFSILEIKEKLFYDFFKQKIKKVLGIQSVSFILEYTSNILS